MNALEADIMYLKGVGPKRAALFYENGIHTVYDLIKWTPKKYDIYELESYEDAYFGDKVCVEVTISSKAFVKPYRKGVSMIGFSVKTDTDIAFRAIMFGASFKGYKLQIGQRVILYGTKKENGYFSVLRMFESTFYTHIEPSYKIKGIDESFIRKLISALLSYKFNFKETLPLYLIEKYRLLDKNSYIRLAHSPKSREDIRQLERREKYEIFLNYSLELEALNTFTSINYKEPKLIFRKEIEDFIETLPFSLTFSQKSALEEIVSDMSSTKAMNRLVEGDVGSGKTIIAVMACYLNYLNGYQAVVMAPTEILAIQHFESFKGYLSKLGVNVGLLSSSAKASEKKLIIAELENKNIDILITTHAILYHPIKFKKLGLYIVDEQHRFGVDARRKLLEDYKKTDAMFLSATPIPRTLGLTRFGDMDISELKEKPMGRKKVLTSVISYKNLSQIFDDMKERCSRGEQIYIVVSVVSQEETNFIDIERVKELINEYAPSISYEAIHGKLKPQLKDEAMKKFINHEIDALISTTVIEVGVDVKNATGIYIFDADRFGLSTIHQLRGRVGRNDKDGYCALITRNVNTDRLKYLEETDDCFELADYDLKMRGPGDLLGTEQSGYLNFNFDLYAKIFECAREDAKRAMSNFLIGRNEDNTIKEMIESVKDKNIKLN